MREMKLRRLLVLRVLADQEKPVSARFVRKTIGLDPSGRFNGIINALKTGQLVSIVREKSEVFYLINEQGRKFLKKYDDGGVINKDIFSSIHQNNLDFEPEPETIGDKVADAAIDGIAALIDENKNMKAVLKRIVLLAKGFENEQEQKINH